MIFASFVYIIKNNTSSLTAQDPNLDRMLPVVLLLIKILFFADFDLNFFKIWRPNACDSLNVKIMSK